MARPLDAVLLSLEVAPASNGAGVVDVVVDSSLEGVVDVVVDSSLDCSVAVAGLSTHENVLV